MNYDEFQREVRRRKRERWAKILASEPPGRAAGRRPRDPEKERILLKLDRARLARESAGEQKRREGDPTSSQQRAQPPPR